MQIAQKLQQRISNSFIQQRYRCCTFNANHFTKYSLIHITKFKLIKTKHPNKTAHNSEALLFKTFLFYQPLRNYNHD